MAENLEQRTAENFQHAIGMGKGYLDLTRMSEEFGKNPSNYDLVTKYATMTNPGLPEDALKTYIDSFKKASPAIVQENMDIRSKDMAAGLGEFVKGAYKDLVAGSPDPFLIHAAYSASGAEKDAETVQNALKEGKTADVRKKYASTFKDKAWAHFVGNLATDDFIKVFAPMYFQNQFGAFQMQFISVKMEGDKELPYLDREKLTAFLDKSLADAKDDKAKSNFYINFAVGLAKALEEQEKLRAKVEAEKKAKEGKKEDKPKK